MMVDERDTRTLESDRPHVVVVDDQEPVARSLAAMLENNGFDAEWTTNGIDVVNYVSGDQVDVDGVVSDYVMRQPDGLELLQTVRQLRPRIPFVLYTGRGSETIASKAIKQGATDYIKKGGRETHDVLVNSLRHAIQQVRVREKLEEKRGRFDVLAAASDAAIVTIDSSLTITYASSDIETHLGYDPDSLQGTKLTEYVPDGDRRTLVDRLTDHFDGDDDQLDTQTLSCSLQKADGNETITELHLGAHDTPDRSYVTMVLN